MSTSATAAVTVFASGGGGAPPSCGTLPPTPSFTWQSPDPVNRPFLISVDAGGSTSLASPCHNVGYNWDFGGLGTPTNPEDPFREGVTMDYEFAAAGTYVISLVVSNGAGDSLAVTQTIVLGATPCNAPTANFTVSPAAIFNSSGQITNWTYYRNNGQDGTAFTFDGTSSAYMSDPACHPAWSWNLGDGSALRTTPIVAGYHYGVGQGWSGTHVVNVTLTVTNDAGTDTESFTLTLVRD